MNTIVDFKSWHVQINPMMRHKTSENILFKIGMDCMCMVAVVAFSALATLIIGS